MAILSNFPATRWQIILNRLEADGAGALTASNLAISGNTVTAITGTGLTRVITLGTAVAMLLPTAITFVSRTETAPAFSVVSTSNEELQDYLRQIRNILRIGLTDTDLPNSVIAEDAFLRAAEHLIYETLGLSGDSAYDTKAMGDPDFAERARISTMYRTAALLVLSLPDIVSESVLQQSVRYAEIDWEKKINTWIRISNNQIEEDVATPTYSDGVIGDSWTRTTLY